MKNLQKLLALSAFALLLFSFSNCGGTQKTSEMKLEQTPPFSVASATHQDWVAGIEGGGSGINVTLTLASKEAGVTLKEIYFNEDMAPLNAAGNSDLQYAAYFKKDFNNGDSMIMDIDSNKEAQNTPHKKFPFELTINEAVISYTFNGKTGYFKIDTMVRKETLALPSNNPNNIENKF